MYLGARDTRCNCRRIRDVLRTRHPSPVACHRNVALGNGLTPRATPRDPLRLTESQVVFNSFDNGAPMLLRTTVLVGLLAIPVTARAQHDYRNLDRGRPLATEDAYPVEAGALEVMIPWSFEREAGASGLMFEPELTWGIIRNAMVGLGAPIRLGNNGGLAGLRPFAFYNFNSQGRLFAYAVRLDGSAPVGALGGRQSTVKLTIILTASFGATRIHANSGVLLKGGGLGPLASTPSEGFSYGIDYTLWRQSAVLIADLQRNEDRGSQDSWWIAGVGVRAQVTPTLVFDFGAQRRLSPVGPDLLLTAGFTRAISVRGGVE